MESNSLPQYPYINSKKKISIKYYLNTKLKPEFSESGESLYPLYFQLLINGRNTVNKSRIDGSKYSLDTMRKIENIVNSEFVSNFYNFKECMDEVKKNHGREFSEIDNGLRNLIFIVLSERMIIYEIVRDLKPFERKSFSLTEFNHKFDLYHLSLKDAILKILRNIFKSILESEVFSGSITNADIYLKIIDWSNAHPYDLYLLFKGNNEKVNDLINHYPYCFQIISESKIVEFPEGREWLIDFYSNQTYAEKYLFIKSLLTDSTKLDTKLGYRDTLIDTIDEEIKALFLRG